MKRTSTLLCAIAASALFGSAAHAQMEGGAASEAAPFGSPVTDQAVFAHLELDQLEGRFGDGADALRWSGEFWVGDDSNRLRLKSEGAVQDGRVEDGRHELVYDRPITSFWDLQVGARADLDSGPARGWAAFGVEGEAPYFIRVSATGYVGDRGRLALRLAGSDDIRFTQRLILEPEIEANVYAKDDPARGIGSGLSDIDAGLRLRYEITRKFAPYVGVGFERRFGRTADFARADGERPDATKLVVGVRSWF